MSKHIDTLAKWWEGAEESDDFYPGDTWIKRRQAQTGGYVYDVGRATGNRRYSEARVLARAPKPQPAWHDAVAVIAHRQGDYGLTAREVYVSGVDDKWESAHYYARTSELIDPVLLIEQKVTDEMVDRLEHHFVATQQASLPVGFAEKMLNIALGLDPA